MNKLFKVISLLLMTILLFSSISVFADDNATGGDGDADGALKNKGFYRYAEYMYKVSVYVGLNNKANTTHGLVNYKMIGYAPIYVKPATFTVPENVFYGLYPKADILLYGSPLVKANNAKVVTDNPPPIPITNGGSISAVKAYFGDTNTLNILINKFAEQKGTTREGLVQDILFTIDGVQKLLPPGQVLPVEVNGIYQNRVPWIIIYEPVTLAHLKDKTTILAFTATEYAMAQKLGYFDFMSSGDGEYINGMTHEDLPNSIVLEKSWFGFPAIPALADGAKWSNDRSIQGGGWGMRFLNVGGAGTVSNDTTFDMSYRIKTNVITSVMVHANSKITPDDEPAYITFNYNGNTTTKQIFLPSGGAQLYYVNWYTGNTPRTENISVSITGNPNAVLEGSGARGAVINATIGELTEHTPPDPKATDIKPKDYQIPSAIPAKADKYSNSWGEYIPFWAADWRWLSNWVWVSNWVDEKGVLVDRGWWEDQGDYVDYGNWDFQWNMYEAWIELQFTLEPDEYCPTARKETPYSKWTMKSGYGMYEKIRVLIHTDNSAAVTDAGNAISYYPEFYYKDYDRVFANDLISYYDFELKQNKFAVYNNRVHFTPLWFPDGDYKVLVEVIDVWTPAGMLTARATDYVNIYGNVYDDWTIGPIYDED